MTDPTKQPRPASENPDRAEVIDAPRSPALDFHVVNDEKASVYEALMGDTEIAGLTYNVASDDRLMLLATSVLPEYRRRGIATELIRRVLDDVRERGKTVTIMCPIVRTFIEHNPDYADLINQEHPGVPSGSRHS